MTRDKLIETAENRARELGWTDLVTEDEGATVAILMGAPGATEQVARASLPKLRRAIDEIGGPELYPAVEEFEYRAATEGGDIEEYMALEEAADREGELAAYGLTEADLVPNTPDEYLPCADLAAAEAEAADHADEPSEIEKPEPELPEPEVVVTLPAEVIEAATQDLESDLAPKAPEVKKETPVKKSKRAELVNRCKELGITGYSRLNIPALKALIKNVERVKAEGLPGPIEDVSGNGSGGVSPKEAAVNDLQDRGGVPRPEQLFQDETLHAPKGHTLIARNGDQERDMCGDSILASVKAAWESEGWKFFSVDKAARRAAAHTGDVVIRKSGHVSLIDGRLVADEGWRIRIAKGSAVQTVKTANPQLWRSKGWTLRAVRA